MTGPAFAIFTAKKQMGPMRGQVGPAFAIVCREQDKAMRNAIVRISGGHVIKMKKKKSADHIANLIVKLVEHTDGPVTLARIARDIPGFAATYESYAYSSQFVLASGTRLIWSDMTKAGVDALDLVLGGRRVAIQFVSVLPYKAAGHVLEDENWWPTVLLPARAANLETPSWLIRASQEYRDYTIAQAAEGRISGHRPLKAHPVYGRPKQGGQSNAR